MLRFQFLFFAPLAVGATCLAWFAADTARRCLLSRYSVLSVGLWVASSAALFFTISVVTPQDGIRHIPTVLGAYSVPFLAIAATLYSVGDRWSRERQVLLALVSSVAASFLSPLLLLSVVCIFQANCL